VSEEYGLVESIFASVQWDRWRFMLSAPRLCKQDVAVISHSHKDHWATNLPEKDAVFIPQEVEVPQQYRSLTNLYRVDYSARLDRLDFIKLDQKRLARYLGKSVPAPHAFWWLVAPTHRHEKARVMFVGDANRNDLSLLRETVAEMFGQDTPLHGVVTRSFAGLIGHGAETPRGLAEAMEDLAYDLRDIYGVILGALPHPVNAGWADYNATTLPALSDCKTA